MADTIALSVKASQAAVHKVKVFNPATGSIVANIKMTTEGCLVDRFLKLEVYTKQGLFESEQAELKAAFEAKSVAGLKRTFYTPREGQFPCADVSVLHGGVVRRKVDLSREEVIISQDGILYIPLSMEGVELISYYEHFVNYIAECKNCLMLRKETVKAIFNLIEFRDCRISFDKAEVLILRNDGDLDRRYIASTKKGDLVKSFLLGKAKNDYATSRVESLDSHVISEIAGDIDGLKKLVEELEEINQNPSGLF